MFVHTLMACELLCLIYNESTGLTPEVPTGFGPCGLSSFLESMISDKYREKAAFLDHFSTYLTQQKQSIREKDFNIIVYIYIDLS